MRNVLDTLSNEPPKEDSPDLTDDEIEAAIPTTGSGDLARRVALTLKESRELVVEAHELRRRGDHLYYRCRLSCPPEPDRVLVFLVDWLMV